MITTNNELKDEVQGYLHTGIKLLAAINKYSALIESLTQNLEGDHYPYIYKDLVVTLLIMIEAYGTSVVHQAQVADRAIDRLSQPKTGCDLPDCPQHPMEEINNV